MRGTFIDEQSGLVELGGPNPAAMGTADAEGIEPVFILRATDKLAQAALSAYARQCELHGIMSVRMRVKDSISKFDEWQVRNPDKLRFPD